MLNKAQHHRNPKHLVNVNQILIDIQNVRVVNLSSYISVSYFWLYIIYTGRIYHCLNCFKNRFTVFFLIVHMLCPVHCLLLRHSADAMIFFINISII